VSSLLGHVARIALNPEFFSSIFSIEKVASNLGTLILFGYVFGLIPAAIAGAAISCAQVRCRRLTALYIFLAAAATALVPPISFLDKDLTQVEIVVGSAVSFLSTLICWILIRRWRATQNAGGDTSGH
jgi:hypothetical protein